VIQPAVPGRRPDLTFLMTRDEIEIRSHLHRRYRAILLRVGDTQIMNDW
jgi:hypothetical protein